MIIAGFGERVIFPVVALILDTGPLYSSSDRSDADHRACRHLIETATETLVIPAPVLVELDYWTKLATLDRRHFGLLRPRHVDALRPLPE